MTAADVGDVDEPALVVHRKIIEEASHGAGLRREIVAEGQTSVGQGEGQ